jgi:hypothetical protein
MPSRLLLPLLRRLQAEKRARGKGGVRLHTDGLQNKMNQVQFQK